MRFHIVFQEDAGGWKMNSDVKWWLVCFVSTGQTTRTNNDGHQHCVGHTTAALYIL